MTETPVGTVARWVSLLFSGLFAGFLVAVLVLEMSLRGEDRHVYTQVRHVELDSLDKLATATLLPALIATAFLVAVTFKTRERTFRLRLTGLALLLLIVAVTVVFNMPINADQLDWDVREPPSDWASVRDHWQIAHSIRTGAAVVAFATLIAASTRSARGTRESTRP
ncbi:anthrone oxygenase family protein [Embleya sp. NPDC001921]